MKNLAEEKITEILNKAKIKTNDRYLISGWSILGLGLIIGGLVCALFFLFESYLPLVFGVFIVFIGIISSLYFFVKAKNIDRANERILRQLAPELFKTYFENSPDLFPKNLNFQFEGIFPSQMFNSHCLHFSLGTEKIVWNIAEDIEERTILVPSPKGGTTYQTYFVYILKICLTSTSQKLNGLSNISIFEGRVPKNNDNFFESESIAFNNRFCVQGWNKMDVYKMFTPKIIDNFLNTEPNFLKAKKIELKNGRAEVFSHGPEKLKSWIPDFFDFSKVRWTKEKMKDDILGKINLDFVRYLEIQGMLKPLELYN